jgi:hypothetical protein
MEIVVRRAWFDEGKEGPFAGFGQRNNLDRRRCLYLIGSGRLMEGKRQCARMDGTIEEAKAGEIFRKELGGEYLIHFVII